MVKKEEESKKSADNSNIEGEKKKGKHKKFAS